MKTLRESFERYVAQYAGLIERNGVDDALLRGAFAHGVTHGLDLAKLSPAALARALEKMNGEIEDLWRSAKPLPPESTP